MTSVSSQFDLLTADLTKYEAALEALQELDLELEEDVDQLSPGSASRDNPRFSQAGRARELEDERNHLARLSVLLQRHGELAARLQEVAEDEDEPQGFQEPGLCLKFRTMEKDVCQQWKKRPSARGCCRAGDGPWTETTTATVESSLRPSSRRSSQGV